MFWSWLGDVFHRLSMVVGSDQFVREFNAEERATLTAALTIIRRRF